MRWTAILCGLTLLVTTQVVQVAPQACSAGQINMAVKFTAAASINPGAPTACTGYLENQDASDERLCGFIDHRAAERACWDTGISGGSVRAYHCIPITSSAVSLVDLLTPATYTTLGSGGTIGERCLDGDPDCFMDCHAPTAPITQTIASISGQCEGNSRDVAITCRDVDECRDGVLYDCIGPLQADCKHRYHACGPHAVCANTVPGFTCTCDASTGFGEGTASDLVDGCTDTDECTTGTPCGSDAICENTIGSYVCLCDAGFTWNDVPDTGSCDINSCPEPPDVLHALKSPSSDDYRAKRTYVCDPGYEPSIATTNPFEMHCRDDGTYCSCTMPTCEKIKCGLPRNDPNAWTPQTGGRFQDTLTHTCLSGFDADGHALYTVSCQANGEWEDPPNVCEDINECTEINDPCPDHSQCYNTIGSHICICDPGFEDRDEDGDCDRVRCGDFPEIDDAEIITTGITSTSYGHYETVVTYQCVDGYQVSYNNDPNSVVTKFELKCKQDGWWSPQPIPECVPRSCGDPGLLPFAKRSGEKFYFQDEVSFTCDHGFKPSDYALYDSTYKTFKINCGADGMWSPHPYCIDINECLEDSYTCGPDKGHLCINKRGSYKCSCAAHYRLDETGHNCIGSPYKPAHVTDPCDIYNTLAMCNWGTCQYDDGGAPHCWCEEGYTGSFCDKLIHEVLQEELNTLPFIMSVIGIILCFFAIMIAVIVGCSFCTKSHRGGPSISHTRHRVDHTPVYQGTPPPPLGLAF